MELSRQLAIVTGAVLLSATGVMSAAVVASRAGSDPRLPFLPRWSGFTIEQGMPPPVQARRKRELRAWLARARAAALAPRSRAAGCERVVGTFSRYLGPPAPKVQARIIGHHVVVTFDFGRLPSSPACRPATVRTTVSGQTNVTGPGTETSFLLDGPRGRVVSDLALFARAPYKLAVTAETVNGVRSRSVDLPLRCPGTNAYVKGCLPGPTGGYPRALALHGVTRTGLLASLRYVVAGETRAHATAARCPSIKVCEVTYVDPDFPRSPYRVRLRIGGEQLSGCWMGLPDGGDTPPYRDAWVGTWPAACVAWLR